MTRRYWVRASVLSGTSLCAWLIAAGLAAGQSIGADPYDPWNSMYRPFAFPSNGAGTSIPNASRVWNFGGNGTIADVSINNIDPGGTNFGSSIGNRFTPYYLRPNRGAATDTAGGRDAPVLDRDRQYVANRNDQFYADQSTRERRFFEALRERDPRKRTELLRKLNQETRASTRASSSLRNRETVPGRDRPTCRRGESRPAGR